MKNFWLGLLLISSASAVTPTNLTTSGAAAASMFTTASITPAANQPVIVTVIGFTTASASDATPTVSGDSLTFTTIKHTENTPGGPNDSGMTMFCGIGASPTTGSLTIDFGGQTQTAGATWTVTQFSGTKGTCDAATIVQNASNFVVGTNITVTLAAFGSSNNVPYGSFRGGGGTALSPGTGFTTISSITGSGTAPMLDEWENAVNTSVSVSSTSATLKMGIAIEIAAAVVAASSAGGCPFVICP